MSAPQPTSDRDARPVVVDGHVHLYDCYRWDRFIEAAASHLEAAAAQRGLDDGTPGCLMLAETRADHAFRRLRDDPAALAPSAWQIEPTGDPCALLARSGPRRIAILAGRQIVTAEGLEVLAQLVDASFDDGRPIDDTIDAVRAAGAVPLLPWGVGKWQGRRGRIVHRVLDGAARGELLLGDNMHRPTGWPRPRRFAEAERKGILVLPGSDPLPLPWQETCAGRYGFVLTGFEVEHPAESLRRALAGAERPLMPVGRRDAVGELLRTQIAMRRRPRAAPDAAPPHREGAAS